MEEYNLNDQFKDFEIQKLSNNMKDSIEGTTTYNEILNVLKTSKNNKSPGSGGFSVEFYNFLLDRYRCIFVVVFKLRMFE